MNGNNSNKLSEIYSRIFKSYLYFSPYFRRNCIELKEIYKWLKALNLSSFNYPDFYILMEWFNALNLIKPLFIVHFPKEHSHHIYFNQAETLSNDMRDLEKLYNDGLVIFPEEIYDNEAKIKSKVKPWQHEKIEHKIKTKLKGSSESDPEEEKIAVEETKYFYHPIQFFQILTYLRGYSYRNLYQHKAYKKFYWERRLNFDDYVIKRLKQKLNEDKESIEDFIQEKLSKGISFNQFDRIFFEQNRWLIEKSFLLWIKIESLFHHYFYKPSFGPNIRLDYQLPIQIRYNRKKSKEEVENHYKWLDKVRNTISNYFTEEDFNLIREFRQHIEIHSRIDGLEDFIDLFLYIDSEKKEKLKDYLSYYVNIIHIVRTLKLMENELIKAYPSLAEFKIDPKWYEPKYFFDIGEEKEEVKYKTKLLLDYGLIQEETFIIFVEGPTEMKLLEDWVKRVLYRTGIKISLKPLRGKKKSIYF